MYGDKKQGLSKELAMAKYIIFDFDGTLVDSKNVVISAFNQLAQKHNFKKMKPGDIDYLRKLPVTERCKILDVPVYKLPYFAVEFYSLYKHSVKDLIMFEGIEELMEELNNRGYNLAIISSNSIDNIKEFLQKNRIDYIKQIICSNKIFGKDKEIKKFLKENKLKNSEVLYIGDEQRDIVACKKSGVKIIWVEWGFDAVEIVKQESPDYMVSVPGEILDILPR